MEIEDEIKKIYEQVEKNNPQIKLQLDALNKKKQEALDSLKVVYSKKITIDGKQAEISLLQRGVLMLGFQDLEQAKEMTDKILNQFNGTDR